MNRFKKTVRQFAFTVAGILILAVAGFHAALGNTLTVDAPPESPAPQPPPQVACVRGCVSASGWVRPVDAPVWGGFHNASDPDHEGVDLGAPKGTPIRAAATGVVVRVRCNVTPVSWGCDRDGGPGIGGCGWYVDIKHDGNIYTRYCHQLRRPLVNVGDTVTAGHIIGVTGDSGHSGAPHLHFEVHKGSQDYGAIDPVVFMADQGAPLGTK